MRKSLQSTGNECAKIIIQAGIREVVYIDDSDENGTDSIRAARILFRLAGVTLRQYNNTSEQRIIIPLEDAYNDNPPKEKLPPFDFNRFNVLCCHDNATSTSSNSSHSPKLDQSKSLWFQQETNYSHLPKTSQRRQSYLSWDDYFLSVAFLSAQRSKDPNTQVGACIVNPEKRVVGIGYNGLPTNCSDDVLPWSRSGSSLLHTKYPYVCHAEANAILNSASTIRKGSTMYVDLFPCNECAKLIIQTGIREVVYLRDLYHNTDSTRASRILFRLSGVTCRQYRPSVKRIVVDLRQGQSSFQ